MPLGIDTVDRLSRGIEQEARALLALAQGRFCLLTHGDFLPQFGCSLLYPKLEFVSSLLQLSVASLNFRQHVVETVDQYADFIVSPAGCANRVISCRGHLLGGLRQQQNGIGNSSLHSRSEEEGAHGQAQHDEPE